MSPADAFTASRTDQLVDRYSERKASGVPTAHAAYAPGRREDRPSRRSRTTGPAAGRLRRAPSRPPERGCAPVRRLRPSEAPGGAEPPHRPRRPRPNPRRRQSGPRPRSGRRMETGPAPARRRAGRYRRRSSGSATRQDGVRKRMATRRAPRQRAPDRSAPVRPSSPFRPSLLTGPEPDAPCSPPSRREDGARTGAASSPGHPDRRGGHDRSARRRRHGCDLMERAGFRSPAAGASLSSAPGQSGGGPTEGCDHGQCPPRARRLGWRAQASDDGEELFHDRERSRSGPGGAPSDWQ